MASRMLRFVDVAERRPRKRVPEARREDFREIYDNFKPAAAREQAARCSQCGVPFCQVHCPLHNDIPEWLMLTAEGRMEEAYEIASATNNMPEICGRICPQDRLCEGNCVIEQAGHGTVTIGSVETYITETAWAKGWVKPPVPRRELDRSVGVVGGGPGGLAAAEQLRKKGYQVEVYDRYDRIGGLLIYGIPNFKLEKQVVERRTRLLAEAGIRFHTEFEVGRETSLGELRARHDAIVLATGVYKGRDVAMPGVGLDNIFPAMEYLTASNRKGLGDKVPRYDDGTLDAAGKRVVVLGAGDTAMDCVRTAVRQGAKSVSCVYRRNQANMPGSMREVQHAMEEGVEFIWLVQPEAFLGNGAVQAVRAVRMRLGGADPSGRQTPKVIEDSQYTLPADLVIKALGFDPEDLPVVLGEPRLGVTGAGTVAINYKTFMTTLDGVFAVGDVVRGASLVVWAIRDGRDAAESVHDYLRSKATDSAGKEAA